MRVNTSIEKALSAHCLDKGYGWNKEMIPQAYHNMFAVTSESPQEATKDTTTNPVRLRVLHELKENGFSVLNDIVEPDMASALNETIVEIVRTVLFRASRVGMSASVREQALQCSSQELARKINAEPLKRARYFKRNIQDLYCEYDVSEEQSRRMKNLQGVQGLTLSSQMVDVYAHPHFAEVLAAMHLKLKMALGMPLLYFDKERCSLRGPGSAPLEAHHDEPIQMYGVDE